MKCLLKYKWVKLPRACLPEGKGVMGSWSRLAAAAAFRKGNAFYCGHRNPVSPGMWSGGTVGVKAILGIKNRQKALDVLRDLEELGYVNVAYNHHTKQLSYQICDWVIKCSGAECMNGSVYATDGYGFLCVPRDTTERLIKHNRIFEEADAWLDLWCHTTYEDFGNAFSFLAPAVQYGKYGAVLTLETLGHRWGWEKTKVWRFFKKYEDVFGLYRLPGAYGCLIFNKLYPTGKTVTMPDYEKIMRIVDAMRIRKNNAHCLTKGVEGLNRLIAWHSREVLAEMAEAETAAPVRSRVALLKSYIRAYFSHGRNCKHCRNCNDDCQGSYLGQLRNLKLGNEIRGPCIPQTLKKSILTGE